MEISSTAFGYDQMIPSRYAYEGEDLSPPLVFKEIPAGTVSLALIVEDPDAPHGTFDHWVAWNIPKNSTGLREGEHAPHEGNNSYDQKGYRGPNPPPGQTHRYFFRLYALDKLLDLPEGSSKAKLKHEMKGHVVAEAEFMGTYRR